MKDITHVYIPIKRHRQETEFKAWCSEVISPYSTEITWICDISDWQSRGLMVFRFCESTDALAFKLKFGL